MTHRTPQMSDFAELIATIEQVRAERYPSLSSELVTQILSIEVDHPEDRTETMRAIKQVVLNTLASQSADRPLAGLSSGETTNA